MKRGTDLKGKFGLLKLDLGLATWECKGLLQQLWDVTAENAPAGNIGRFPDDELAMMLDWKGDPGALVDALVRRRWLDVHPEHRLVVHEWPEHCEDYIHMRLCRKIELFADGTPPRLQKINRVEREEIRRKYYKAYGIDPCHEPEEMPAHTKSVRTASDGMRTPSAIPSQPSPSKPVPVPLEKPRRSSSDHPEPIQDALSQLVGGEQRGRFLAGVIVQHSGEAEGAFVPHYTNLYLLMEANHGGSLFEEAVAWVVKSRDPVQRRTKDIGEMTKPGGYIQSVCKKHLEPQGIVVPKPPIAMASKVLPKMA